MRYRLLGSTGLRVSVVALGCGNVGGLFTGATTDAQAEAIRRASQLGISGFDTAPQYGQGRSETNLGRALKEAGARDAWVSTKVRLAYEDLRDIPGAVRRSAEASLERLGMDQVALLQLHNPVTETRGTEGDALGLWDVLGRRGVLEALDRLRGERLCQAVGFTALGQTSALQTVARSGGFQAVQVYYNLLNPTAGRQVPPGFPAHDYGCLLDDVADQRMGALAIRSLAAGALADPPRADLPALALSPGSDFAEDQRRAAVLAPMARRLDIPLAKAALRFALGDLRVSSVLVGVSDLAQIEEAAQAADEGPLPQEFLEAWERLLATDFREAEARPS